MTEGRLTQFAVRNVISGLLIPAKPYYKGYALTFRTREDASFWISCVDAPAQHFEVVELSSD